MVLRGILLLIKECCTNWHLARSQFYFLKDICRCYRNSQYAFKSITHRVIYLYGLHDKINLILSDKLISLELVRDLSSFQFTVYFVQLVINY